MKSKDDGDQAAAELYRLAQAHALLRTFRDGGQPELDAHGKITPTAADFEAVEKEHSELARRAGH